MALPHHDSIPESPIDWEDVPMGPGQDPPRPNAHMQWSPDLGKPNDIQRDPDHESFVVVHRWPERPA